MSSIAIRLISDFNIEPMARYLRHSLAGEEIAVEVAPFGQVYQSLNVAASTALLGTVVWTLPEGIIPSFSRALQCERVDVVQCLKEVDDFCEAVLSYTRTCKHVFLASWVLLPDYQGYGLLDWHPNLGIVNLLARMNLRLAERLGEARNIYILDADRWLHVSSRATSSKMWYATKVPYANQVFERAAATLRAALLAVQGRARKLVVLDLDNTLWGGVIGETGWEGIRLGGHDFVGEAYVDFQHALKALSNRGIQLAIVSKNDESVALEAIDKHPEMVLRRDRLAGWRIDWNDKAQNLVALAEELNLGLEAVVFIDDNPAERARIRSALPQVLVPEWPIDPTMYVGALHALECFGTTVVSTEDRQRTAMYIAERERRESHRRIASIDDWLSELATKLVVNDVDKSNIARVAQLFKKTNQMNLSTRRLTEQEIIEWAIQPKHRLVAIAASDRFGDMGLVGALGMSAEGRQGQLVDFILSCRVTGRKVEDAMMHIAVSELIRLDADWMEARYLPTLRNRPTLDVFRAFGLVEVREHVFGLDCRRGFPKPKFIEIEIQSQKSGSAHA